MNTVTKKFTLAGLGAVCALTLSLGTGLLVKNGTVADADTVNAPSTATFFHDYLLDANGNEYTLAKKFYKAFEKINESGDFKKGVVDYPVDDVVTSAQLKAWVEDGNLEVPRAFSAARDAYLTDHPEIFYIDFYKLTLSVAKSGSSYVGFIDCGKNANAYRDNGFNTVTEVANAIEEFESKVNEVVTAVNNTQTTNTYTARDVFLAKEVNNYLAKAIEYDNGSFENKDNPDAVTGAYINTPYGGLVDNLAVCGGYSTAYKVIMDRLGIPCITVNGYSNNKDENGNNSGASVYHMWNYVWLENPVQQTKTRAARATTSVGEWYSVDVTWDSSAYSITRYAVLSASVDEEIHVTDGEISSSGYKLRYPQLSPYTYGGTVDTDGLQLTITYEQTSSSSANNGDTLYDSYFHASYNGKDAKRLLDEDGLFMAFRFAYYRQFESDGELIFGWTPWYSIEYWRQALVNYNGGSENDDDMIQNTGNETRIYGNTSEYYVQVAVFDAAPTIDPTGSHNPVTEYLYFYCYSDEVVEKTTAVAVSDVAENETYGTYTPPPYIVYDPDLDDSYTSIKVINDSMRSNKNDSKMDAKNAFTLRATYNQNLHIIDDTKLIGISFTSIHPNTKEYAFFVPFEDGAYVHLLDDNRTLEFKFCPSLMYEHNKEDYHFFFTNVGSNELVKLKDENGNLVEGVSNKLPNSPLFCFERRYMACPKAFNYDGRLWVDCCAQPELVANSDLAAMNFLDKEGGSTFSENGRSQMMLVAEKITDDAEKEILDQIADEMGDVANAEEIVESQTYDINLQICGKTPFIPDGSYVKIALGFPEGYGPNDTGVTFKIYHRKHDVNTDTYFIEEIPCVVTQFGIVAVCTSFSPYTVAVFKGDKTTSKNVYASIEGNGGTLSKEDGQIISLTEQNDSYTYTIKPDAGYQIHSVKLNGESVAERVVNDKLKLTYDELDANNQLVIEYISDEAAARYQQKVESSDIDGFVDITKYVVPVDQQPVYSNAPIVVAGTSTPDAPLGKANVAAIVITSFCVAIAIGASIAVLIIALRKKA